MPPTLLAISVLTPCASLAQNFLESERKNDMRLAPADVLETLFCGGRQSCSECRLRTTRAASTRRTDGRLLRAEKLLSQRTFRRCPSGCSDVGLYGLCFRKKRSMAEPVQTPSLNKARAVFSTGAVLEAEPKPMKAW